MNWFKSFWKKSNAPQPAKPRVRVEVPPRNDPASHAKPCRIPEQSTNLSNFTPRAQQTLALARKEADRMNHNFVGTEHVLLGLIKLSQGAAVNVLRIMGLDLEKVRMEVEKLVGTGPDQKMMGNLPYTPRVKKVLALATKEAKALNHTYVGTEHLLLGLLLEGDGVAARVLKNLKVDVEQTRQEILKELDPNFGAQEEGAEASASAPSKSAKLHVAPLRVQAASSASGSVDTNKRYDVYCTDYGGGTTVYRNARFKGIKHLFQQSSYDALSRFIEIEQSDGQTIFVSRSSILKFCEHKETPGEMGDHKKSA